MSSTDNAHNNTTCNGDLDTDLVHFLTKSSSIENNFDHSVYSDNVLETDDETSELYPSGLHRQDTLPIWNVRDFSQMRFGQSVYAWAIQFGGMALPSFCRRQSSSQVVAHDQSSKIEIDIEKAGVPQKTRYNPETVRHLDGLRGIACFLVFNFHFLYPWTYTILHGYGRDPNDTFMHQLPLICLVVRGRAMVTLFFAISGYVLSYKILRLARGHDAARDREMLRMLSSSVFRRGFRLYGPPFFSMLAVAVAARYGMFNRGLTIQNGEIDGTYWLSGSREEHPLMLDTWTAQSSDFMIMLDTWSNLWTWNLFFSHYDPHTWTIPLEFRSSMILFMVLLATFRLRRTWRMVTTLGLVVYCLVRARWEVAVFLGGIILVELDLVRQESRIESDAERSDDSIKRLPLVVVALILGLYLLSYPDLDARTTPGYTLLASWTPELYKFDYMYWHSLGSLVTLWSINNNTAGLKSLLERDVCLYLGKISFAFYLVHGPLLHSLGLALMPEIWTWTGHQSNTGFVLGLLAAWFIMLMISIWIADIFWRLVDVPCTRFAKKLEALLMST